MSSTYRWWVDQDAYEALMSLSPRRRAELESVFRRLAARPGQKPAFTADDADGKPASVIFVGGYWVTYHVDHAACRVEIFEIVQAP